MPNSLTGLGSWSNATCLRNVKGAPPRCSPGARAGLGIELVAGLTTWSPAGAAIERAV
jgi:hypothetical protein